MDSPAVSEIRIVWINRVSPIDRGWRRRVNKNDNIKIEGIKSKVITENSLNKILVLGIKDKVLFFFSEVLRKMYFILGLQDQSFCLNY